MTAPTLRLTADENVPLEVVTELRARGFDVEWLVELSPGADDVAVLKGAGEASRVLLTLDKDFGDLIFNQNRPPAGGVILLRGRPQHLLRILLDLLSDPGGIEGHFTVVEQTRVRRTRLPTR